MAAIVFSIGQSLIKWDFFVKSLEGGGNQPMSVLPREVEIVFN